MGGNALLGGDQGFPMAMTGISSGDHSASSLLFSLSYF